MQREARKLLSDMLDAARAVQRFVIGRTPLDLSRDELLNSGIYFKFIVIGEALSQLHAVDEALYDRISEAPRIVGFRNQIIHGYSQIDDEITWRIIEQKLPILINELEQLLRE
jgi:uncharacterized protein with HEPN domain